MPTLAEAMGLINGYSISFLNRGRKPPDKESGPLFSNRLPTLPASSKINVIASVF
jgi:hypothetical protein